MEVGVHVVNAGVWASHESIVALGTRAETLGFDSLWVSDQVIIPSRVDSHFPYSPTGRYPVDRLQNTFEAITVLTYLAGRTSHIKLGTSVLVLPYRQPLVIAKQWATLDALSGGRTIFGVGAGFMRDQFEALGVACFDQRGTATDEAIKLTRAVWSQEGDVTFDGEVYRFGPIRFLPKPAQPGGPPIWVGGHTRPSIRRAAQFGDGWHVVGVSTDELHAGVAALRDFLDRFGRQSSDVVVSAKFQLFRPGASPQGEPQPSDLLGSAEAVAAKIRAYHAAGLRYLIVDPGSHETPAEALEAIEFFASDVRPLLA